jgi:hypothetical protein
LSENRDTEALDDQPEGGRALPAARIIEMIAVDPHLHLAPCLLELPRVEAA